MEKFIKGINLGAGSGPTFRSKMRKIRPIACPAAAGIKIKIEISGRHIHLSADHLAKLFGPDYQLRTLRPLSQTGEFAAEETVNLISEKGDSKQLRIIGPIRDNTQVEISRTDALSLGLNPPVRMSGDLSGSESAILSGPVGKIKLKEGIIIAHRHIHCPTSVAKKFKLKNNQKIKVGINGERGLVYENVKVKIKDNYELRMHIDTDEANAAGISKETIGKIVI